MSEQELSDLRRDASRYRWLRAQDWTKKTVCVMASKDLPLGVDVRSNQRLDELIDAALAASKR